MNEIGFSIWEPVVAKQPKLDQILSLKTAQERSTFKVYATRYASIMREIQSGQVKLSGLADSTQEGKFDGYDISSILKTHENNFTSEFEMSSQTFGTILQEITENKEPAEDLIGMFHIDSR